MIRRSFNADWTAGPGLTAFAAIGGASGAGRHAVELPHDAIRDLPRSPGSPEGSHTGYFPGGSSSTRRRSPSRTSTATRP